MSHIVVIDGMNFLHRARSGWQLGPAPVVFNFMRNFRSVIDQLRPTKVYFVLEGKSLSRKEVLPEYKANRKIETSSPEFEDREKFFKQSNEIIALLRNNFPISVIRHPHYECDDTIYNLIKTSSSVVDWTVVSNDTDFIQLLNEFSNVKIWNPMKKSYVGKPPYDYVTWKALRGDSSDNIPGIPGVGDKKAESLALNLKELQAFLDSDIESNNIFNRNFYLIKFIEWTLQEKEDMTFSFPSRDWSPLKETFEKYSFSSLLKEGTWNKFIGTFETLWNN